MQAKLSLKYKYIKYIAKQNCTNFILSSYKKKTKTVIIECKKYNIQVY